MNKKRVLINIGKVLLTFISVAVMAIGAFVYALIVSFGNKDGAFYAINILICALLAELAIIGGIWGFLRKKIFYIPLTAVFVFCLLSCWAFSAFQKHIDSLPTVGEGENFYASYAPYAKGTKAVTIDEESTLIIDKDPPVMDGATALYPIYSSFAKAVYPKEYIDDIAQNAAGPVSVKENGYLKCTTTINAYENIVTGEADIIFAALPSKEQEEFAKEHGTELIYTPIGKEAFVFFVNSKNPINDISAGDIRKIYSGEMTEWEELGIKHFGKIKAFQRDKGSGSQSTMEKFMQDKPLMSPPTEDVVEGMGGIIERAADYKNYKNAIGYSFRFYSAEMVKNDMIKLLSINGVYPDIENIENGKYPLASYFYAVTRSDADENTKKLLEWIQGEQGQKIIEKTGYTPINKAEE